MQVCANMLGNSVCAVDGTAMAHDSKFPFVAFGERSGAPEMMGRSAAWLL